MSAILPHGEIKPRRPDCLAPYTPGSGYVLLHHSFGEVNGKKGVWGHAIGGMGAITQAMAKAAAARGVDIRLSTRVRQVLVENGQAIGVETDKGETIRAAAVAAGINPKLLYLHLDARALPEGFRRRMEKWRCGSGTFRMNVALSELPDFTALQFDSGCGDKSWTPCYI
jgi:phytoene dehydrogenase-like protein